MRTLSTSQEDVLKSVKFQIHTRVELEDSTGGMVSVDSLGVGSWFEGAQWDWDLDQPVAEMTLRLRRDHGLSTGQSLSPLDEESTLNYDASTAYAPFLDPGREFRVYTAATTPGGAPTSSEMDWVFKGETDDVMWAKSPIEVVGRSFIGAKLYDRWVETPTIYSTGSTEAVEVVIADVIAAHTDLSSTIVTTPTSPGFLIKQYEQQPMRVLDAVTTLAQLIGWDLREKYSSSAGDWVLELSEPDRTATSSDAAYTFGPSEYFDVKRMDISRDDVRNAVDVEWGPSSSRQTESVESTASQDKYGRRWVGISEAVNSAVDTSSEANTLANAVLSDLKDPPASHEIELPYWWPGELRDYYGFAKNGIHYSTDQYLAAYGFTHRLDRDEARTYVRVRGQPAGQYLRWQQYPGGGNVEDLTVTGVEVTFDLDGFAVVSAKGGAGVINMYVTVSATGSPSDPTAASNHGAIGGNAGSVTTTVKVGAGAVAYVKVIAASTSANVGEVYEVQFVRAGAPFFSDNTDRVTTGSTSAYDTLDTVTIPGGILGTNGSLTLEGSMNFDWGSSVGPNPTMLVWFGGTSGSLLTNLVVTQPASSYANTRLRFRYLIQSAGTSTAQDIFKKISWDPPNSNGIAMDDGRQSYTAYDSSTDIDLVIQARPDDPTQSWTLDWTLGRYYGST